MSGKVLDSWEGTPISTASGDDGKFTISSRGPALYLKVEKLGYYRVEKGEHLRPSIQGFDFGVEDTPRAYKSNRELPNVFQLWKAENPLPLERLNATRRVPLDGRLVAVGLSKTSNLALQISCRTMEDETQPPNAAYDWHCEISLEGGGFKEADDEMAFEAPADGYASAMVIDMPKTLDVKLWSSDVSKSYWLRLSDNTYAKIGFRMIAGGDHFAEVEGWHNPTPNDRNLEPILKER